MSVPRRARGPVPWRVGDLLVLYATTTVGIVVVLAAWYAASGEVRLNDQVGYATLGTAGVVVLGAGNLAWLLAGRRATGMLRRQLLRSIATDDAPPALPEPQTAGDQMTPELVATRTMTRFHRPDCLLVNGKTVRPYSYATHVARGRRPCDVCRPESSESTESAVG